MSLFLSNVSSPEVTGHCAREHQGQHVMKLGTALRAKAQGRSQHFAMALGRAGCSSVLILVVPFTVSEGLCGNCLIDSREANSNLDRYKVFSLSSHKTFSWICSNYPWGEVIFGLKALLHHLPSALHFTEANTEDEGCTQAGPKSQGEREAEAGLVCSRDDAQDGLRVALLLPINRGVFIGGREGGREGGRAG